MIYHPSGEPPERLEDLRAYLYQELLRISEALQEPEFEQVNLTTLNAAPDKPREGNVVRADGTNWNPGAGEGVYEYDGTTYNKL